MRTLVDLEDAQVRALDELSRREKQSCAALIQAIDEYLARRRDADGFGLWGNRKPDGLAYQEKIRSERRRRCSTPTSWSTISTPSRRRAPRSSFLQGFRA
jgi:hypothetical protein